MCLRVLASGCHPKSLAEGGSQGKAPHMQILGLRLQVWRPLGRPEAKRVRAPQAGQRHLLHATVAIVSIAIQDNPGAFFYPKSFGNLFCLLSPLLKRKTWPSFHKWLTYPWTLYILIIWWHCTLYNVLYILMSSLVLDDWCICPPCLQMNGS